MKTSTCQKEERKKKIAIEKNDKKIRQQLTHNFSMLTVHQESFNRLKLSLSNEFNTTQWTLCSYLLCCVCLRKILIVIEFDFICKLNTQDQRSTFENTKNQAAFISFNCVLIHCALYLLMRFNSVVKVWFLWTKDPLQKKSLAILKKKKNELHWSLVTPKSLQIEP